MDKLLVIESKVYVAVPEDTDPEEVASTFQIGAASQFSNFPHGEITGVDVDLIREGTDEEKSSHFEE